MEFEQRSPTTTAREPSPRERLARLIGEEGPVSASALAETLRVSPTAVRRQLDAMSAEGLVEVFEARSGERRRGRPAKSYVLTDRGHASLQDGYRSLATSALDFLADEVGERALERFARHWAGGLENRYAAQVAAEDPTERVEQLTRALNRDGYAATCRRMGTGETSMQLCQGHCPVYQVAGRHPALCEAEREAFSRLLGLPVARLASLARGDHVCTTHIGLACANPDSSETHPDPVREGTAS